MGTLQPYLVPLGLMMLVAVVAAGALGRMVRARRRVKKRVVEAPNSHFAAPVVRARETSDRWHRIDVERLHEINRDEVKRLLARIDAAGIDSLRPQERTFLERMDELAR